MNNATAFALNALLAAMTSAQRVALMDVLSMHVENVETSDECADGKTAPLETDGHVFLVAVRDALISDLG